MSDPMSDPTYTKGQQAFIEQMTRKELVRWCNALITGSKIEDDLWGLDFNNVYVQYALNRKSPWISKKANGRYKILAAGWATATAFLKR